MDLRFQLPFHLHRWTHLHQLHNYRPIRTNAKPELLVSGRYQSHLDANLRNDGNKRVINNSTYLGPNGRISSEQHHRCRRRRSRLCTMCVERWLNHQHHCQHKPILDSSNKKQWKHNIIHHQLSNR